MTWILLSLSLCLVGLVLRCLCCGGCIVFQDTYISNRLADDYIVDSGTWDVSGGTLNVLSTGLGTFATVFSQTTLLGGKGRLSVKAGVSVIGGTFRIVVAYVNSDNYLFVQGRADSASIFSLTLYQRSGGSETLLRAIEIPVGVLGGMVPVSVCWDGRWAKVHCDVASGSVISHNFIVDCTAMGPLFGLAGSPNGGMVSFDDLVVSTSSRDVATCSVCQPCTKIIGESGFKEGTMPNRIQLEIEDVEVLTLGNEEYCDGFNDVFILTFSHGSISGASGSELIGCDFQGSGSNGGAISLAYGFFTGRINIAIPNGSGPGFPPVPANASASIPISSPHDGMTVVEEFFFDQSPVDGGACFWGGESPEMGAKGVLTPLYP